LQLHDRSAHRQVAAWLNAIYGVVHLGGLVILGAVFGSLSLIFMGAGVANNEVGLVAFGAFWLVLSVLIVVGGSVPFLAHIATAVGLVLFPEALWTTVIAVISATMAFPVFPYGTLLSAHLCLVVFWDVVMPKEAEDVR